MSHVIDSIEEAFAGQTVLKAGIYEALRERPQHARLFDDIGRYILSIVSTNPKVANPFSEHPSKKRKLDEPTSNGHGPASTSNDEPRRLILEARDISFSLPQRKKLHLGLVQYGSSIEQKDSIFAIQARNPATNQVEFEYPITSFAHALRLPVPEKNQKQYNFCLLPAKEKTDSVEPVIWTINHGPLKSCKIDDTKLAEIAPGPEDILEDALGYILSQVGITLTTPSEDEFASALRESHRKTDIAYHVKAFRGSKEGYLFFLKTGIFFGFKKPLTFFPFHEIESVSYTSVLQRTFNLSITVRISSEEAEQEIEYSMLDQADFPGIDSYIKRHQLQDASLAEARRAKKSKANGTRSMDADADDDDGRTELEKAEAELEDEEDELEEDYDPDAESDDSGSESGEEDYRKGKGRDLVAEELGSEAEDVSASEEEEDDEEGVEEDEDEEQDDGEDGEDGEVGEVGEVEKIPKVMSKKVEMKYEAPLPQKSDYHAPSYDDDDQL